MNEFKKRSEITFAVILAILSIILIVIPTGLRLLDSVGSKA